MKITAYADQAKAAIRNIATFDDAPKDEVLGVLSDLQTFIGAEGLNLVENRDDRIAKRAAAAEEQQKTRQANMEADAAKAAADSKEGA